MIAYIRNNGKIKLLQAGRPIPLVHSQPPFSATSEVYSAGEIALLMESGLFSEETQFYAQPCNEENEGCYRLFVGQTAYEPFTQSLASQFWGYISAVRAVRRGALSLT
jgi:hypothetical protein